MTSRKLQNYHGFYSIKLKKENRNLAHHFLGKAIESYEAREEGRTALHEEVL